MADDKPIIIIKKKGGHGGSHGGAWKIAYADFVTAMMCFFLVMWLVNSAEVSTRQNIAQYFKRPGIFSQGSGTPLEIGGAGILDDAFSPTKQNENKGSGKGLQQTEQPGTPVPTPKVRTTPPPQQTVQPQPEAKKGQTTLKEGEKEGAGEANVEGSAQSAAAMAAMAEEKAFGRIVADIKAQIAGQPELAKLLGLVDVKIDADGLNIDIMDTEKTSMFALGNSQILPEARSAFTRLAELLKPLPNQIDIVGHTDARPFSNRTGGYSNWELSADRANAARKVLELAGIEPTRIISVVGRADRELKNKDDSLNASNRRITLKMRFKISRRIDLSKDSALMNNLDNIEPEQIIPDMPAPTSAPNQPTENTSPEVTHDAAPLLAPGVKVKEKATGYRPKKLIKAAEQANQKVGIPDPEEPQEGQTPQPKSQFFNDNPVVGPGDPFNNF